MSKTRKFVVVLMTFFLAVLTALGVLAVNTRAEDGDVEIEWPTTFTADDWQGDRELRLPTGFVSKNQQSLNPSAEMLGKVKITRGQTTYACSHIYEWNGCLTFYFNNTDYTGKTAPQEGDVLGVDAGLSVVQNGTTYVSTNAVSWTYNGELWLMNGVEIVPANVTSVTTNNSGNTSYPLVVQANTDVTVSLGNNATLNTSATERAKVTLTRGGVTLTAPLVRGHGQAIQGWFQSTSDVTLEVNTFVRGDIFRIAEDLTMQSGDGSVTYQLTSAVAYIYDGTQWIEGTELPGEPEDPDEPEVEPTSASVASVTTNSMGNSSYPIVIAANTDVAVSLGGNADLNAEAEELEKVTYTRGGVTIKATLVRGYGQAILGWFQSTSDVTFEVNTPVRGDIFRIAENFTFNSGNNAVTYRLDSAIEYIYDGTQWIEGTELPDAPVAVSVSGVESVATPFPSFPIRVDVTTNGTNLGNGGNLAYVSGTHVNVTYTRGETSVTAGAFHADGSVIRIYFSGSAGIAFEQDTPLRGDILTLGAGFAFTSADGSVSYAVEQDITYIYTGSAWIEGTELPTEVTVSNVAAGVSSYASFPIRVDVTTNATNLGGGAVNLNYAAGTHRNVTYTRNGTSVATGALHGDGSTIRVYFASPAGMTFEMNESLPGDIFTFGAGFAFSSQDGTTDYLVGETLTYIYTVAGTWVEYVPATGLDVQEKEISVEVEKTAQIHATIAPEGSTEVILFESLSPEIATVDATGLVLGVAEGTVEIRVTAGSFSATVMVTVTLATVEYVKTGIRVTENGEQTIYSGRDYAVPTVAYVYEPEKEVTEYVPAEAVSVDEGDFDNMIPDTYTLTVRVLQDGSETEYYTATFTVTVVASTPIAIDSITTTDEVNGENNDSTFFVNTTSDNTGKNDEHTSDAMLAILPYVEFYFPNGTRGNVWACRVNGSVVRFFVRNQAGTGNINTGEIPTGSVFTVLEGFGITEDEYLAESVSYVYNGTMFETLVEPEEFTISVPKQTMYAGTIMQITVNDAEDVNVIYEYYSVDPDIGTVDGSGLITAHAAGTLVIRVSWRDLTQQIEITVTEAPADRTFEITTPIPEFWVPVSTEEAPTSFAGMGYTLTAHYVYDDGSETAEFAIEESQLGTVDYTTAGTYQMVVTDTESDQTDTVTVVVYEYKDVQAFDSVGVSGYDINDTRNQEGTWNGHMMISMRSYSTNATNLLTQNELNEMASYIEYTTADGKVYYRGSETSSIGLWTVGTNLLVMIRPEGATGNMGYGGEDTWKEPYPTDPDRPSYVYYDYVPIYKQGDKITFKKGMPIYAWKGNETESNRPLEGEGYLIIEGYLDDDYTYYCYDENGTRSLWSYYKEYTDFTVSSEMTISAGGTASVGAVRVPADATTGTFTYASSDESIVTVTAQGNMIGMAAGTATITVTLSGGMDENGEPLDDIVKTITVTVVRSISSISGSIEIAAGTQFDPSQYQLTVTYSDGSTEQISLSDERVTLQNIDTSTVGETTYNVAVTIDGETMRGTVTVRVVEASGGGGCGSSVAGTVLALTALAAVAGTALTKKKRG